jgi:hypothetical protein
MSQCFNLSVGSVSGQELADLSLEDLFGHFDAIVASSSHLEEESGWGQELAKLDLSVEELVDLADAIASTDDEDPFASFDAIVASRPHLQDGAE